MSTSQVSPRGASAAAAPCIATEAKRETEEILNAILPPKEWEEDGQIWTQKVIMLQNLYYIFFGNML